MGTSWNLVHNALLLVPILLTFSCAEHTKHMVHVENSFAPTLFVGCVSRACEGKKSLQKLVRVAVLAFVQCGRTNCCTSERPLGNTLCQHIYKHLTASKGGKRRLAIISKDYLFLGNFRKKYSRKRLPQVVFIWWNKRTR